MRAHKMRSHLWVASVLVGLGVITVSCGTSTPAIGVASPTLTPSPSPTATISPTATATSAVNPACRFGSVPMPFSNPPGPLPTTIPLPPGTLVGSIARGINAGSVLYYLCTPGATQAGITAFMDSALPAAGWLRHSVAACNALSYDWYKGNYGMDIVFNIVSSVPDVWGFDFCPHVGQN
jgi:hypothetical protein